MTDIYRCTSLVHASHLTCPLDCAFYKLGVSLLAFGHVHSELDLSSVTVVLLCLPPTMLCRMHCLLVSPPATPCHMRCLWSVALLQNALSCRHLKRFDAHILLALSLLHLQYLLPLASRSTVLLLLAVSSVTSIKMRPRRFEPVHGLIML